MWDQFQRRLMQAPRHFSVIKPWVLCPERNKLCRQQWEKPDTHVALEAHVLLPWLQQIHRVLQGQWYLEGTHVPASSHITISYCVLGMLHSPSGTSQTGHGKDVGQHLVKKSSPMRHMSYTLVTWSMYTQKGGVREKIMVRYLRFLPPPFPCMLPKVFLTPSLAPAQHLLQAMHVNSSLCSSCAGLGGWACAPPPRAEPTCPSGGSNPPCFQSSHLTEQHCALTFSSQSMLYWKQLKV